MNLDYKLTKQDFIEFNLYHLECSKSYKKSLHMIHYIASILVLIFIFICTSYINVDLVYTYLLSITLYIIWLVLFPKYFKKSVIKNISKILDEGKNKDMYGDNSLQLTEDSIISKSKYSESKVNFKAIEKVIESKEYIYIYISAVMAYIIPIRAFKSTNEKSKFIEKLNFK